LQIAQNLLDDLHDTALQDKLDKLVHAERFADAVNVCKKSIADQEEQVRTSKDRDAAVRRLAHRLGRFGWFLAHCPEKGVRDTKAAVGHAKRATDLQPDLAEHWYTLAMVQYRGGIWRDSLATLEKLKAREGGFTASSWILMAMNRHRLAQKEEARAAMRKAVEWIEDYQRKAKGNAVLMLQFDMMRPEIEALMQEARDLLGGGNAATDRDA
jgi:tetratricopeptide (TPR) repeat protein